MHTTIEELVDGDTGVEYIQQYVVNTMGVYKPPPQIADIVESLILLDERDLNIVRGTIAPMLEGRKQEQRILYNSVQKELIKEILGVRILWKD